LNFDKNNPLERRRRYYDESTVAKLSFTLPDTARVWRKLRHSLWSDAFCCFL